jgi:NAD(P)-dependent dehydrogenase (short-subunit alcohol dehydrogenase family)
MVVADVNKDGLEETASMIRSKGGVAESAVCDVSDEADVETLVEVAVAAYGRLDFAHNNAGIQSPIAAIAKQSAVDWERVLAVNLTGVFLCMKHEIPRMLDRGGGVIVNTASIAGLQGFVGTGPYVASKHGVIGLTRAAALEYGPRGIRVNAVCPGITRTGMVSDVPQDQTDALARGNPLRRIGEPAEIAEAVVWLCSSAAAYVTGTELVVDGGLHCG